MGCDIHMHTEVKIEGQWHHYGSEQIHRDYQFFAILASVRNYDKVAPISEPRGLPGDATYLTRADAELCWAEDGHSHSWLSLDEMLLAIERRAADGDAFLSGTWPQQYIFGYRPADYREFPDEVPSWVEEIRFVFWFDS